MYVFYSGQVLSTLEISTLASRKYWSHLMMSLLCVLVVYSMRVVFCLKLGVPAQRNGMCEADMFGNVNGFVRCSFVL